MKKKILSNDFSKFYFHGASVSIDGGEPWLLDDMSDVYNFLMGGGDYTLTLVEDEDLELEAMEVFGLAEFKDMEELPVFYMIHFANGDSGLVCFPDVTLPYFQ